MTLVTSSSRALGGAEALSPKGRVCQWVQVLRLTAVALSFFTAVNQHALADTASLLVVAFVGAWFGLHRWARRPGLVAPTLRGVYLVLDTAIAGLLAIGLGAGSPIMLYLIGSGVLGGLLFSTRTAAATAATLSVAVLLATWVRSPESSGQVLLVSLPPLATAAGHALQRLLDQQRDDAQRIARLDASEAAAQERMRLARDLHDGLTKSLHGVAMSAQADATLLADGRLSLDGAAGSLHRLARMIDASAVQARELIHQTRAAAEPLTAGLTRCVDECPELDLRVTLDDGLDELRVPRQVRAEVVAVVSEALHNASKHAPGATVQVDVRASDDALRVVVSDDGPGFDASAAADLVRHGHFGLAGMRERAERAGGTLTLTSTPGAGATLELLVPLAPGSAREPLA
ncbi:MAG TPA: ATP-binding protein [Actinomycetales bacterium]|nr:ATP-binding protein [Actinomycetales bacterium]